MKIFKYVAAFAHVAAVYKRATADGVLTLPEIIQMVAVVRDKLGVRIRLAPEIDKLLTAQPSVKPVVEQAFGDALELVTGSTTTK